MFARTKAVGLALAGGCALGLLAWQVAKAVADPIYGWCCGDVEPLAGCTGCVKVIAQGYSLDVLEVDGKQCTSDASYQFNCDEESRFCQSVTDEPKYVNDTNCSQLIDPPDSYSGNLNASQCGEDDTPCAD